MSHVEILKDDVTKVVDSLEALAEMYVLVGIPSKNAAREDSDVNSAAIGYVMEFGSPVNNVRTRQPCRRSGSRCPQVDPMA